MQVVLLPESMHPTKLLEYVQPLAAFTYSSGKHKTQVEGVEHSKQFTSVQLLQIGKPVVYPGQFTS